MPFSGIADSGQLTVLTTALDDYCRNNGIGPTSPERDDIARIIMSLFSNGVQGAEDLKSALEMTLTRNESHRLTG